MLVKLFILCSLLLNRHCIDVDPIREVAVKFIGTSTGPYSVFVLPDICAVATPLLLYAHNLNQNVVFSRSAKSNVLV
ncbi:MAG: hypothetical protein BWY26_00484 [Elusimicrobia bacterium ADurb.Bin231]|nr:MAG: hypothetical protein BWY26_00484 [Elusimicrobia bacterium ADurb.Bin231]